MQISFTLLPCHQEVYDAFSKLSIKFMARVSPHATLLWRTLELVVTPTEWFAENFLQSN
jgi:hypothetical protein